MKLSYIVIDNRSIERTQRQNRKEGALLLLICCLTVDSVAFLHDVIALNVLVVVVAVTRT